MLGDGAALNWPPTADDYYLPAGPSRPVMQGDVFNDVPFVKASRGNKHTDDPNLKAERRKVATIGYPCDMYLNGRLARVQAVAPVVDAEKRGVPADWDGAFTLAPLPDLEGDGRMWAVDFSAAANIDAFYLNRENRVRALSELGWAIYRQRLGLTHTRLLNHLTDLMAVGSSLWHEMAMWQRWNEAGKPEGEFQSWLDGREIALGGFTRRNALDRGMFDTLKGALERALA